MNEITCPDCGCPITNESVCPECGCPIERELVASDRSQTSTNGRCDINDNPNVTDNPYTDTSCIESIFKIDCAQYIYECGVIGWEAFKKYFHFKGRASRREFWSLMLIFSVACIPAYIQYTITQTGNTIHVESSASSRYGFMLLIFAMPMIGAMIRRLHDIGKCGWWCLCPIVPFFLYLKQSDKGSNKYGNPYPAKEILKSRNITPQS